MFSLFKRRVVFVLVVFLAFESYGSEVRSSTETKVAGPKVNVVAPTSLRTVSSQAVVKVTEVPRHHCSRCYGFGSAAGRCVGMDGATSPVVTASTLFYLDSFLP